MERVESLGNKLTVKQLKELLKKKKVKVSQYRSKSALLDKVIQEYFVSRLILRRRRAFGFQRPRMARSGCL